MKVFLNLLWVLLFLFYGCISSRECESKEKEIKGISAIVGNEPFTKPAIITDQQNVYLISAPQEIKNLLIDNQGHYFRVRYVIEKDSADIHIIEAVEATKL